MNEIKINNLGSPESFSGQVSKGVSVYEQGRSEDDSPAVASDGFDMVRNEERSSRKNIRKVSFKAEQKKQREEITVSENTGNTKTQSQEKVRRLHSPITTHNTDNNNRESKLRNMKSYLQSKNKELLLLSNSLRHSKIDQQDFAFSKKSKILEDNSYIIQDYYKNKNREVLFKEESIRKTLEAEHQNNLQRIQFKFSTQQEDLFQEAEHSNKFKLDLAKKKQEELEKEKHSLREEVYLLNRLEASSKDRKQGKFQDGMSAAREILREKLDVQKKNLEIKYKTLEAEVSIEEESRYYREMEEVRKNELFNVEKSELQFKASVNKMLEEYRRAKEEEFDLETKKYLKKVEEDNEEKIKKFRLLHEREIKDQEDIFKNSENEIESHYFNALGVVREELRLKNVELEKVFGNKLNSTLKLFEDKKFDLTNAYEGFLHEMLFNVNAHYKTNTGEQTSNEGNLWKGGASKGTKDMISSTLSYPSYLKQNSLSLEEFLLKNCERISLNFNIKKNKTKNIDTDTNKDLNQFTYLLEVTQEVLSYFNEKNLIKSLMATLAKNQYNIAYGNLSGSTFNNNNDVFNNDPYDLDPYSKKNTFEKDIKEIAKKVALNRRMHSNGGNVMLSHDNLNMNYNPNSSNQFNFNFNNNNLNNLNSNSTMNNASQAFQGVAKEGAATELNYLQLNLFSFTLYKEFVKDLFLRRFIYSDNTLYNEILNLRKSTVGFSEGLKSKSGFANKEENCNYKDADLKKTGSGKLSYNNSLANFKGEVLIGQEEKEKTGKRAFKDYRESALSELRSEKGKEKEKDVEEKEREIREDKECRDKHVDSHNTSNHDNSKLMKNNNHSKTSSVRPPSKVSNRYDEVDQEQEQDPEQEQGNRNTSKIAYNIKYSKPNINLNSFQATPNQENQAYSFRVQDYDLQNIDHSDLLSVEQSHQRNLIVEFLSNTEHQLCFWKEVLELKANKFETMKNNLYSTSSRVNDIGYNLFTKYSTARPNFILNSSSTIYGLLEDDQQTLNKLFNDYERACIMYQEIFSMSMMLFNNTKNLILALKEGNLDLEIERIKNLKKELEGFMIEASPSNNNSNSINSREYRGEQPLSRTYNNYSTTNKVNWRDREIGQGVNMTSREHLTGKNTGGERGNRQEIRTGRGENRDYMYTSSGSNLFNLFSNKVNVLSNKNEGSYNSHINNTSNNFYSSTQRDQREGLFGLRNDLIGSGGRIDSTAMGYLSSNRDLQRSSNQIIKNNLAIDEIKRKLNVKRFY